MVTLPLFKTWCDHLVMITLLWPPCTMSLFQEVVMANLLCLYFASVVPPICPANLCLETLYFWTIKSLIFPMSNADLLNITLGGDNPCTQIKEKAALINLAMTCVGSLSSPICGTNIWRPQRDQNPNLNLEFGPFPLNFWLEHLPNVTGHIPGPWSMPHAFSSVDCLCKWPNQ